MEPPGSAGENSTSLLAHLRNRAAAEALQAESPAAHDVNSGLSERRKGPRRRLLIHAAKEPVDFSIRPANETIDRHRHLKSVSA
jgi:hypothetical protein